MFLGADLSNSNFESVNLSPQTSFTTTFKNKADLKNLHHNLIVKDLFGEDLTIRLTSTEVRGNDLAVNYVFFNNFANANLENANFKNADLSYADFYAANLTNADISGADLTNANLFGADLTDTVIDANTILKCKNHPICLG